MFRLDFTIYARVLILTLLAAQFVTADEHSSPLTAPSSQNHDSHDHEDHNHDKDDHAHRLSLGSVLNPSISLTGDMVLSWAEKSGREAGADGFALRSAELGIKGEIDKIAEYHAVLFTDEEEVELEEAYVLLHGWLQEHLRVKGGRFHLDFGQRNQLHSHELETVDHASVLQEYLGGSVRGTGAELGWWSSDESPLTWHLTGGVLQSAEGDAHATLGPAAGHGHDDDDDESGPIREVEDFAIYARARVDFAAGAGRLEIGGSVLNAPTAVFGVDSDDERDLDHLLFGLDLAYSHIDHSSGRGFKFRGEWLANHQDFGELDTNGTPSITTDDTYSIDSETASGFYALAEYHCDHDLSFGVSANFYKHAEDSQEDSHDLGLFATLQLSESNRLRAEIRSYNDLVHEDDGVEEQLDFVAFMIQWTITLGEHNHDH